MDPIQVAVLTLIAIAVGIFIPVMIQFWLTLRQVQLDLREAKALFGPVLEDIRSATSQLRHGAQITAAIAAAVAAGTQAWIKARQESSPSSHHSKDAP